jgi:hypothetical protein
MWMFVEGTMTPRDPDARVMEDPEGQLERTLIEEFLRSRGLDEIAVRALPDPEAKRVRTEASQYAAAKLAEVNARAHFVHDIHGDK